MTADKPVFGYRDSVGNVFEEDAALDILDSFQEDNPELTLEDIFERVETKEFGPARSDAADNTGWPFPQR